MAVSIASRVAAAKTARPGLPHVRVGQLLLHIFYIAWGALCIFPFIWMIFASFKPFKELMSTRDLLPHTWTLAAYQTIIQRVNFLAGFANSLLVAVTVTVAAVLTSAAMGFIFAKYRFPGKEKVFVVLLATMMVPFAVVMVPLYVIIARIGLANQLAGIMVTGICSTFGIFMLRQFMESIPDELIDAARIDGASEWRIFFTIIGPMSGAPMAALAVFTFLGSWDSLIWPLIVLSSPEKQTLPLILAGLRNVYWTRYELYAAGSMLTVVPVMILYSFASRYFIRGLAMTGMKL
jgi:multiple sugar transport system permease protein